MCGVAGVFAPDRDIGGERLAEMAATMTATLRHRGPDGDGCWVDAGAGIALGHRRLSIIDLSPTGAQPMHSPGGRFVVTYNGEIYNYRELRQQLQRSGVRFAGTSDTEVLAAGLDEWGLDRTVDRLDGMFAFGAWDRRRRELHLVRDRFGEKPLYWGAVDGRLLFGSELRALAAVARKTTIDHGAVADVLSYKCVQGIRSIYREFQKVAPGHYITVDSHGRPTVHQYWSAVDTALRASSDPLDIDEPEAAAELTVRLESTVASRMVADVPVGAFLSGGIDSAGITAFMVRSSTDPVRTYTVGLDDPRYDEADAARSVADKLGTDHHPLRVTPAEILDLIPKVAATYDEPFADSSQLPTLLVSSLAASEVKVVLTGDGGDEVFGGYNRHVVGDRLMSTNQLVPWRVRRPVGTWLQGSKPERIDAWFHRAEPWLPPRLRVRLPSDKLHKVGRVLAARSPHESYSALVSDPMGAALSAVDGRWQAWPTIEMHRQQLSFGELFMLADTQGYLPSDVLVKLDRAAMSVSLETRAPYLDHRLFEWSWRLPSRLRNGNSVGKRVLRTVVADQLGELHGARVKTGFGVPVGEWLRGPLRGWAEDLFSANDAFVRAEPLRSAWRAHLAGIADHTHELWSVLMLRSWLAVNTRGPARHRVWP